MSPAEIVTNLTTGTNTPDCEIFEKTTVKLGEFCIPGKIDPAFQPEIFIKSDPVYDSQWLEAPVIFHLVYNGIVSEHLGTDLDGPFGPFEGHIYQVKRIHGDHDPLQPPLL